MQLHHEPVVDRQARHLHQHVPFEAALIVGRRVAISRALEEPLRLFRRQLRRVRLEHAVIGGRRAERREVAPAFGDCGDESGAARDGGSDCRLERAHVFGPRWLRDADERVWPEGGNHAMAAVAPVGAANGVVMRQRIGRGVRRRQHLDAELLEQRARQELGARSFSAISS